MTAGLTADDQKGRKGPNTQNRHDVEVEAPDCRESSQEKTGAARGESRGRRRGEIEADGRLGVDAWNPRPPNSAFIH